jgi:hypothetical protein
MDPSDSPATRVRPFWTVAAWSLWGAVLLALLLRAGLHPARPSSLTTYLKAGAAWPASQPLYTNWRGFVYPPPIAFLFSLFARLPLRLAAVLWRLISAGVFLGGLAGLLRSGVFNRVRPGVSSAMVLIAALPLSIGNLDNAQANPLVAGLMMLAVAALQAEAWTLCALSAGIATVFKVYPLALALLLCVLRPKQLSWRLALFVILLLLLPFGVQHRAYVSSQYAAWLHGRLSDDRTIYTVKDAPLDLWYLLVRLAHLPLGARFYKALQAASALALAVFVWLRRRRRFSRELPVSRHDNRLKKDPFVPARQREVWRHGNTLENDPFVPEGQPESSPGREPGVNRGQWTKPRQGRQNACTAISPQTPLAQLYLLVTLWMLLLGPATENQTYVILAPAACIIAVQSRASPVPMRILAAGGYALLLAAVFRNSFLPHLKSPAEMAIQPIGALLLLAAVLLELRAPATPASPA